MADGASFSLTGLDELLGKLDAMDYDTKRKGGRFALRKAAQVIRDRARANAAQVDDPLTPESIEQNIVERWNGRHFRRTGELGFRVGVLGGARQYQGEIQAKGKDNPGGDTYYWRFLEFGTSKMQAQPIMRPAMDESQSEAMQAFTTHYNRSIDRAIRRAQRRKAK